MQAEKSPISVPRALLFGAMCAALLLALLSPSARAADCANEAIRVQQGPAAVALPDCRAYEFATPGSTPFADLNNRVQGSRASVTGNGLAYWTRYPASDAERSSFRYLATRGPSGWSVEGATPQDSPSSSLRFDCEQALDFSSDLSKSVLSDGWDPAEGLSPSDGYCGESEEALVPGAPRGVGNLYLRSGSGSYSLVNLTPEGATPANALLQDYTADFSRILFAEAAQLTPEAPPGNNLYQWSDGTLRLVPFLPNGEPVSGTLANGGSLPTASGGQYGLAPVTNAISLDGEDVFFYANGNLYLRRNLAQPPTASGACTPLEPNNACTVQIDRKQGGSGASGGGVFWYASRDGSRVFFAAESKLTAGSQAAAGQPDLYEYEVETGFLRDRTRTDGFPGPSARGFSGAGGDASYLYFVARGVLTGSGANSEGAVAQPLGYNLYLLHDGDVSFIAGFDGGRDSGIWQEGNSGNLFTAVSPSGRYLAFSTAVPLTGFDNTPAEPWDCAGACEELFLFDAQNGQLTCASCDSTGARPLGDTHVAGPTGFSGKSIGRPAYFAREVFDDGRMFFTTPNPLVPGDVNGAEDVYRYLDGEPKLISFGAAPGPSVFLDASPGGSDIFFATSEALVGSDTDNAMSIYDARVGGGFSEPPSPPPPCEGEACRGAASAPGVLSTPGSLSFLGPQEGPKRPRRAGCKRGFVKRQGKCRKKSAKQRVRKHRRGAKKNQRHGARNANRRSAR